MKKKKPCSFASICLYLFVWDEKEAAEGQDQEWIHHFEDFEIPLLWSNIVSQQDEMERDQQDEVRLKCEGPYDD